MHRKQADQAGTEPGTEGAHRTRAAGATSGQSARGSGGEMMPVASAAGSAPGSAAAEAPVLLRRKMPLPPLLLPPCRLEGLRLRPRRLLGEGGGGRSRSGEVLRWGQGLGGERQVMPGAQPCYHAPLLRSRRAHALLPAAGPCNRSAGLRGLTWRCWPAARRPPRPQTPQCPTAPAGSPGPRWPADTDGLLPLLHRLRRRQPCHLQRRRPPGKPPRCGTACATARARDRRRRLHGLLSAAAALKL